MINHSINHAFAGLNCWRRSAVSYKKYHKLSNNNGQNNQNIIVNMDFFKNNGKNRYSDKIQPTLNQNYVYWLWRIFADGKWQETKSGKYMDIWNPSTGEKIAETPCCTEIEVLAAVKSANAAFPGWDKYTAD